MNAPQAHTPGENPVNIGSPDDGASVGISRHEFVRRCIHRAVLFAIIGAIVSTTIAIGSSQLVPTRFEYDVASSSDYDWLNRCSFGGHTFDGWESISRTVIPDPAAHGWEVWWTKAVVDCRRVGASWRLIQDGDFVARPAWMAIHARAGWPLLCCEGGVIRPLLEDSSTNQSGSQFAVLVAALQQESKAGGELRTPGLSRPWPLRPIWTAFALNSMFHGLVLFSVVSLVSATQRWNRRRCGRCPMCAYPIGISSRCSECGAPVTPRPQPAS